MKKAYALVIACILSLTFICMPFTGVFADSDIGISNVLLTSCFAWYTGTPGVDTSGVWYGSSFEDYSDSVEGGVSGTTSFGVQCSLNTSGDYVDYQLNEYPFYANSWNSPILVVQLLLDRSSYGGPVEDLAYEFYTDTTNVIYDPFYQYVVTRFTLNNIDYVVMNLFFNIGASVNAGHPHIKIMYDGTPANFIAMGMRFLGYRYSPDSNLTTAELYQLQMDLITSFNMARLLDALGSDDSDIDLSTIENALASMDAKLTAIISNSDNIESLLDTVNNSILLNTDQIELFQDYIESFFVQPVYSSGLHSNHSFYWYYDNTLHYIADSSDVKTINAGDYWRNAQYFNQSYIRNGYLIYRVPFPSSNTCNDFEVSYFIGGGNYLFEDGYRCFAYYANFNLYIYIPEVQSPSNVTYIQFFIRPLEECKYAFTQNQQYYIHQYDLSWFQRIEVYIRQMILGFGSSSVSDDITSAAAELDQEAQSVESFEYTYQTQLQGAHDDVDLTEYPINATNGMTYLQTYTNRAFVASNGFRVFIIYPLIFVLIGIFLRRFV